MGNGVDLFYFLGIEQNTYFHRRLTMTNLKSIEQEFMIKKIEKMIHENKGIYSDFCFYHCGTGKERIICCDNDKCKLHPDYIGKKILKTYR